MKAKVKITPEILAKTKQELDRLAALWDVSQGKVIDLLVRFAAPQATEAQFFRSEPNGKRVPARRA